LRNAFVSLPANPARAPPELINCIDEAEAVYLSSIVMGELFAGFSLGKREKENRESLLRFLDLPAVEVVNAASQGF
jgi:predicted nucleic acid-binding protein